MDKIRKRVGEHNNPIVNGGANSMEGNFVVIHENRWDKGLGVRDFRVPLEGTYAIRIHAAGRVPSRQQVVESATKILKKQREEDAAKDPKRNWFHEIMFQQGLAHFQTDREYDYGPPRIKLTLQLGSQPRLIGEFDVDGRLTLRESMNTGLGSRPSRRA